MLKKNIKIIKGTLRPEKEKFSKVIPYGGFYYTCDGFRMVRFEELPDKLPLFEDNEPRSMWNLVYLELRNKHTESLQCHIQLKC